jgi:hypothetical protein
MEIRQILTSTAPGHTLSIKDYTFFIRDLESWGEGTGSSLVPADKDPEEELKRLVEGFHQTTSSILSTSRCEIERQFALLTLNSLTRHLGDALPEIDFHRDGVTDPREFLREARPKLPEKRT